MKKYFTKYLPVEGEIKEGDWLCNPSKKEYSEKFFQADVDTELLYQTVPSLYEVADTFKVALFLCSRDIQVGDKFDSANGTNFLCSKIDSERIYSIGGLHSDVEEVGYYKDWCYKPIGEISEKAIWVKEGDEFDDEDILLIHYLHGGRGSSWDLVEVAIKYVKIKCPTCKQFH